MNIRQIKTILFTILQFACYIAVFLQQTGMVDSQVWANNFVLVVAFIVTLRNWWMNNSFTGRAKACDEILDFLNANPDIKSIGIAVPDDGDKNEE